MTLMTKFRQIQSQMIIIIIAIARLMGVLPWLRELHLI